VMCI